SFHCALLFHCHNHHLDLHPFPTRRSSDLEVEGVNDRRQLAEMEEAIRRRTIERLMLESGVTFIDPQSAHISSRAKIGRDTVIYQDRKSTRLNSSHQIISYAVFCLKKKKKY